MRKRDEKGIYSTTSFMKGEMHEIKRYYKN